jgi:hypothetical protein
MAKSAGWMHIAQSLPVVWPGTLAILRMCACAILAARVASWNLAGQQK